MISYPGDEVSARYPSIPSIHARILALEQIMPNIQVPVHTGLLQSQPLIHPFRQIIRAHCRLRKASILQFFLNIKPTSSQLIEVVA